MLVRGSTTTTTTRNGVREIVAERQTRVHVFAIAAGPAYALDECVARLSAEARDVCRVETIDAARVDEALAAAPASTPRVAIVGVEGEGPHGMDLVSRLKTRAPRLPLLVVTSTGEADAITRWLACGADDYITPPFTRTTLVPRVVKLAVAGPADDDPLPEIEGLVGRSRAFMTMMQQIRAVARCDGTVLIQGETGTGKELCARAIHQLSARRGKPFCAINCGAIPRDLVENELFGHRQAAFTGASASHVGLIAASEGGTLLFDEVDSFGPGEQATLLRFVQNQEYRPLGATKVLKADVRVLAATNANLAEKARRGEFREDLFYRLDMLRLVVPPLRERREDIPLLARHALATFARRFRARARAFSDSAMEALVAHDWPGNVRQLEHIIGRAVAFGFHEEVIGRERLEIETPAPPRDDVLAASLRDSKRRIIEDFERSRLCAYLAAHEGNIARAAQAAGKNRRAFWELMRKYGIRAQEFQPPRAARPS